MDRTPRTIDDYSAVIDPIRVARQAKSGNQPGNLTKAAQALLALVESKSAPVRLFLSDDALGVVEQQLESMKGELSTSDALSRSTSFGSD